MFLDEKEVDFTLKKSDNITYNLVIENNTIYDAYEESEISLIANYLECYSYQIIFNFS